MNRPLSSDQLPATPSREEFAWRDHWVMQHDGAGGQIGHPAAFRFLPWHGDRPVFPWGLAVLDNGGWAVAGVAGSMTLAQSNQTVIGLSDDQGASWRYVEVPNCSTRPMMLSNLGSGVVSFMSSWSDEGNFRFATVVAETGQTPRGLCRTPAAAASAGPMTAAAPGRCPQEWVWYDWSTGQLPAAAGPTDGTQMDCDGCQRPDRSRRRRQRHGGGGNRADGGPRFGPHRGNCRRTWRQQPLSILERKVIPYRHLSFLFVTTFDSFHGSEA